MASSPRRPAAGVTFGAVVLVVFGLILPAVYSARYASDEHAARPAAPTADAGPTSSQRAVFDHHASDAPGIGVALRGRDDYLFLGDLYEANISQALGWRHYSTAEVTGSAAVVRDQQAWLARRDIASTFVVVPAKWDVYSDKLPRWTRDLRLPTTFDRLRRFAPDTFVDIRPPLKAARTTAETYSRRNSHWSSYGGDVGYRAILKSVQAADPRFSDVAPPAQVIGTRTVNEDDEFPTLQPRTPNDWTVPLYRGQLPGYDVVSAGGRISHMTGDRQLDMLSFPVETRSGAPNSHRVLVLGDSTTSAVSNLIAGSFHSAMFVRHFLDQPAKSPSLPSLVAAYKPDLVLTLVSERNLNHPLSAAQPSWQAALDYDAGTGGGPVEWADRSIGRSDAGFTVPPGAGSVVLALSGVGAQPARLTFRSAGADGGGTTVGVGPGAWTVFVRLPASGDFVVSASRSVRVSSINARYVAN